MSSCQRWANEVMQIILNFYKTSCLKQKLVNDEWHMPVKAIGVNWLFGILRIQFWETLQLQQSKAWFKVSSPTDCRFPLQNEFIKDWCIQNGYCCYYFTHLLQILIFLFWVFRFWFSGCNSTATCVAIVLNLFFWRAHLRRGRKGTQHYLHCGRTPKYVTLSNPLCHLWQIVVLHQSIYICFLFFFQCGRADRRHRECRRGNCCYYYCT